MWWAHGAHVLRSGGVAETVQETTLTDTDVAELVRTTALLLLEDHDIAASTMGRALDFLAQCPELVAARLCRNITSLASSSCLASYWPDVSSHGRTWSASR